MLFFSDNRQILCKKGKVSKKGTRNSQPLEDTSSVELPGCLKLKILVKVSCFLRMRLDRF